MAYSPCSGTLPIRTSWIGPAHQNREGPTSHACQMGEDFLKGRPTFLNVTEKEGKVQCYSHLVIQVTTFAVCPGQYQGRHHHHLLLQTCHSYQWFAPYECAKLHPGSPEAQPHQEIDESLLNLYITLPFFPCVSTCITLIYT